jgi:hypothetical protein
MQHDQHVWYYRRHIMLHNMNFQYYMGRMLRTVNVIGN